MVFLEEILSPECSRFVHLIGSRYSFVKLKHNSDCFPPRPAEFLVLRLDLDWNKFIWEVVGLAYKQKLWSSELAPLSVCFMKWSCVGRNEEKWLKMFWMSSFWMEMLSKNESFYDGFRPSDEVTIMLSLVAICLRPHFTQAWLICEAGWSYRE